MNKKEELFSNSWSSQNKRLYHIGSRDSGSCEQKGKLPFAKFE